MDGLKPIKRINSRNEFIFSKGKKIISFNKSSKIFHTLENLFPGNVSKEYDVNSVLGFIEAKKKLYCLCKSNNFCRKNT